MDTSGNVVMWISDIKKDVEEEQGGKEGRKTGCLVASPRLASHPSGDEQGGGWAGDLIGPCGCRNLVWCGVDYLAYVSTSLNHLIHIPLISVSSTKLQRYV